MKLWNYSLVLCITLHWLCNQGNDGRVSQKIGAGHPPKVHSGHGARASRKKRGRKHFKGADDIRLLILTEDLKVRWALQQQRMATAETGLAKIVAWAEALYDFARENPQAVRLQAYWDYKGIDRKLVGRESFRAFAAINEELAEGLRAIFRLWVQEGSLRPDLQIDMCISQFLHSLRSVMHRALSPTYSFAVFDSDEYLQHFLDLFSRAIRNTKGQPI